MLSQMMGLNSQQSSKLQQVWGQASQMAQNVNSQQDAINVLQNAGINTDTLAKVRGLLNNPMARLIAGALGVNLNNVAVGIDTLANGNKNTNAIAYTNTNNNANNFDKFKQGLSQLK